MQDHQKLTFGALWTSKIAALEGLGRPSWLLETLWASKLRSKTAQERPKSVPRAPQAGLRPPQVLEINREPAGLAPRQTSNYCLAGFQND